MIYLDSAATTFLKPPAVYRAVETAMRTCASPGRGGYAAAQAAERTVYRCRALAAELFDCPPESVCFTSCATEGLNIAIRTLVRPGDRVVISGLEHNAVTRPLHAIGAVTEPVRAPLFSSDAWAEAFAGAVTKGTACVICTQVSNVFGAVLPIDRIAALCAERGIPLIVDASQAAGLLPVRLCAWKGIRGCTARREPECCSAAECRSPCASAARGASPPSRRCPIFCPTAWRRAR